MKILHFTFRGEHYMVNESGEIKCGNNNEFSKTWIFRGGITHHLRNWIDVPLQLAFRNPALLNKCLGVDIDHGTCRVWGGRYNGKLPRICNAYVTEE